MIKVTKQVVDWPKGNILYINCFGCGLLINEVYLLEGVKSHPYPPQEWFIRLCIDCIQELYNQTRSLEHESRSSM